MSFRKYGGVNFSSRNNLVKSHYANSTDLTVTNTVGQQNSYIEFLSDIIINGKSRGGNSQYTFLNLNAGTNTTIDADSTSDVDYYFTSPTTGGIIITLPAISSLPNGKRLYHFMITGIPGLTSPYPLTINTFSGDTISNSGTSIQMTLQGGSLVLVSNTINMWGIAGGYS